MCHQGKTKGLWNPGIVDKGQSDEQKSLLHSGVNYCSKQFSHAFDRYKLRYLVVVYDVTVIQSR